MSTRILDDLIGRAVASKIFCAAVLNGQRRELLKGYDLDPEDVAKLMTIQADTLEDFAAAVEHLISRSKAAPGPARHDQFVVPTPGDWLWR